MTRAVEMFLPDGTKVEPSPAIAEAARIFRAQMMTTVESFANYCSTTDGVDAVMMGHILVSEYEHRIGAALAVIEHLNPECGIGDADLKELIWTAVLRGRDEKRAEFRKTAQ